MRMLWNIVSFLAVVHLLALLMFLGWLWQSQRLTAERVQEVRQLFAASVPEAQAAAIQAAADVQAQQRQQAEQDRRAKPPMDSGSQIQYISLIQHQEEQSRRRLEDDKKALLQQLAEATGQVNHKQAALDRQRLEWENSTRDQQQRKTDGQFLQAVTQLEQLTSKQGKKMLIELINQKNMDQAVTYLDAMNVRAASKILKEFKTDSEIALATELLERLRTYGRSTAPSPPAAQAPAASSGIRPPPETGNANPPASIR